MVYIRGDYIYTTVSHSALYCIDYKEADWLTDISHITKSSMAVISYGQRGFVFKLGVERHGFAPNLDV